MKKYLISLDKDQHRRDRFFAQENTQDFNVFSAINTMENQHNLETLFNQDKFQQHYARKVTNGEIGCTLSHLAVYRHIAEDNTIPDNEYCLICEDDVLFTDNFQSHLINLLRDSINADILLVGQSKIKTFDDIELEINYPTTFSFLRPKKTGHKFTVCYPYRNYFAGTVAYLIKKSAAKHILNQIKGDNLPYWLADDFILFEQFGIQSKIVRPLMAIENPQLQSNLSIERKELSNTLLKKLIKYPFKKLLAIKRNRGK